MELYWFNVIAEEMITRDDIDRMASMAPGDGTPKKKLPRKHKAI